jgi:hypothetical protein
MIRIFATAAIFSCVEFHNIVEKIMSTDMTPEQKVAVIAELVHVTEFGCEREIE